MSHLNIYITQELEKELRKEARSKKLSLSAYFLELLRRQKKSSAWNKEFLTKALGGWKGDFPEIERKLPGEIEFL